MHIFITIPFCRRRHLIQHRDLQQGLPLRIIYSMLILLFILCADSIHASVDYVQSEIHTGNNRQGYWNADMNGDGLHDIVIATWSEPNGREFLIYTQEANGRFSDTPWRRIEIKKDIIAFSIADIRSTPGSEFIFFTRSACYSLSCDKQGYKDNLKRLFEWDLIKSIPDKKSIDYIGELKDLDNDGFVDMLIPGQEHYTIFKGGPNEEFSRLFDLPVPGIMPDKAKNEKEEKEEDTHEKPADYRNLIVTRFKNSKEKNSHQIPILSHKQWIPAVSSGRFNQDDLPDFIYLEETARVEKSARQLNLVFQPTDAKFTGKPDRQQEIDIHDQLSIDDINGDNLTDIVTIKQGILNTTIYFYINHKGNFNFNKPDQVIKISGFLSEFHTGDYNRDGFPDLTISAFSVSPLNTAAIGTVGLKLLIFAGLDHSEGVPLFDRKPSFSLNKSFTVDDIKGLSNAVIFSGDLDGDDLDDIVSMDKSGALTAAGINRNLELETEPFFKYMPRKIINDGRITKLNKDKQADLILEHQHSITILISQQGEI